MAQYPRAGSRRRRTSNRCVSFHTDGHKSLYVESDVINIFFLFVVTARQTMSCYREMVNVHIYVKSLTTLLCIFVFARGKENG